MLLFFAATVVFSCSTLNNRNKEKNSLSSELDTVYKLMSGEFSSKEQSIRDSTYYNINLVMYPIWEENLDSKWLYVEQAVTENLNKPYRQRIYKVSQLDNGMIESKVYELPEPEKFIRAWNNNNLFEHIKPASLIDRQGCAVYLKKDNNGCYTGATKEKQCLSSLRGATYASSIVTICNKQIISWDQGWNEKGEQVWGATKEGYIFKRK